MIISKNILFDGTQQFSTFQQIIIIINSASRTRLRVTAEIT